MKRIIIDIDNTLWDLSPELWAHLLPYNRRMPPPSKWDHWDFWEGHVSMRDLLRALREVHDRQDIYPPYPESRPFLRSLKERGFHITIASHRDKSTMEPTVKWLNKHELAYDEIHLTRDKTVLFGGSVAIVDDSPVTLDKAAKAGILRAGLLEPWNAGTGHPLFESLPEVLEYLSARIRPGRNG